MTSLRLRTEAPVSSLTPPRNLLAPNWDPGCRPLDGDVQSTCPGTPFPREEAPAWSKKKHHWRPATSPMTPPRMCSPHG